MVRGMGEEQEKMTPLDEINDLARKLEPVVGRTARGLWLLNLFSRDGKEASENKNLLRLLADQQARVNYQRSIRLPPPEPAQLIGDYNLGTVIYPDSPYGTLGLRPEELVKHVLIAGMTGTGKTNLALHILKQLGEKGVPFLVFDWKQNYRKLKKLPSLTNLKVIRIGDEKCDFKFNPLIPPAGIEPQHWIGLLIDVIKHSFFVSYGPEYFMRKGIDELYRRFGVYDGSGRYPTFADLQKVLQKEYVRGREMLWMSSVKRVMSCVTFSGVLGEVFEVRKSANLGTLFDGQVVLELDNLATVERIFLIESLLLWLYHYRKAQGKASKLRNVIVVEEAHHILSGRKEAMLGEETIVEGMIRMIREFGVGVIAIDQEPSKLSRSLMANTNCKICLNLGSGFDIEPMAKSMGLLNEEKNCIDLLKVGEGIVKLKSRFSEPVYVKFPLVSEV